MTRRLFILFLPALLSLSSQATHIVGGEIFYRCLGSDNYEITLKLYRDCLFGQAQYDNPARVGVFNSNGVLQQTLPMSFPGSQVLPVTLSSPCYTAPTNVCVEEAIYTYTVSLPPIAGGYILSYQRCCRNNTILNLSGAENTGATYSTKIPDVSIATCNSTPSFTNFPPIFLCADVPFTFDHSATDPDGDSLAYDFFAPYHGASAGNPMPNAPDPPPYPFVSFLAPYSGTNPMSSFPAMAIDPQTAIITGTPNMLGQWVVGVRVREYRNGVLLGENKRDFQFNVTACPNVVVSSFPSQETFCFGFQANFINNSVNAQNYHWDFGVSTLTNDTSNAVTPSYTYPAPGTYTVTLIGNPGEPCADTATSTFKIDPLMEPSFVPPPPKCFDGNTFDYTAGGTFAGSPASTFSWNFGPNGIPSSSTDQNPSGISFSIAGIFTTSLTISESGCIKTYTNVVVVNPSPTLNILPSDTTLCMGYSTTLSASGADNYSWLPTSGINPATGPLVTATGVATENYTITGTNNSGCFEMASVLITVIPTPTVSCENASTCLGSAVSLTASGGDTYTWFPASGLNQTNTPNVTASPTITTVYELAGAGLNGCTDTIDVMVTVNPMPTIDVGPDIDMCLGFTAPLNASGAFTYSWTPFTWLDNSTGATVMASPSVNISYTVSGIDLNGCTDSDDVFVGVNDSLFADAGMDVTMCSGSSAFLFGSGGVNYTWSPTEGLTNSTIHNPIANPTSTLTYTLTVFGGFCPTFTDSVNINVVQFPDISVIPANASICAGTTTVLSASNGANYYEWSPAEGLSCTGCQNPVAMPTNSGFYVLKASMGFGCYTYDTVNITLSPSPISNFTIVVNECDVEFINLSTGAVFYQWNFGNGDSSNTSQTPTHIYSNSGTYSVTLMVESIDGCADTYYSLPFFVNGREDLFVIPNLFTPNGDGTNDGFKIELTNMTDVDCKIYNKWGSLVYELFLPNQVWDGRLYSGTEAPEGVYYYFLKAKSRCEGTAYENKGIITLFR